MNPAVKAAISVYTKETLEGYDEWVNYANQEHWRCPTENLVSHCNEHITGNHLDVGVGSGYYLDHCRFTAQNPRIGLMDLNEDCLNAAAKRIARYNPEIYCCNVLEAITMECKPFESISCIYLFHCLPGNFAEKGIVFSHLSSLLKPGGTLFGATVLCKDVERNPAAIEMMNTYNEIGAFNNREDSPASLERAMGQYFNDYHLRIAGCVGIFWCKQ